MGIIRSVLNADAEEIKTIRTALDAKSTAEPVIREQRTALSAPVPVWASKLDANTSLTAELLSNLDDALSARVGVLQGYPEGKRRDEALERHHQAHELVRRLRADLGDLDTPESADAHHHDPSAMAAAG